MTPFQNRVKHFMTAVGQDVPNAPTVPDNLTRVLRVSLLLEEALEFAEASGVEITLKDDIKSITIDDLNYNIVGEVDMVEVADACADCAVINAGNFIAYGFDGEPLMNEVCDSNDSKIDGGYRREDGKWMKSKSYKPANLAPLINQQINQ